MAGLYDFPIILGMSSSQLTKSYFSEGFNPPSSHGIDEIYPIIHHYIQIISKNILENNVDKKCGTATLPGPGLPYQSHEPRI
jgi:hypothetical protein